MNLQEADEEAMDIEGYAPRVIDGQIERYLKRFGALCVEGPKWCGKTWTGSRHANSVIRLDDPAGAFSNRAHTELDPYYALSGAAPRLIDEWQEVPEIWDAVRYEVDQSGGEPGLYILTGSSMPVYKGVWHSGAGRIATIRMHTMSMLETGDSTGAVSLRKLCDGELSGRALNEMTYARLAARIVAGGWPMSLRWEDDKALIAAQYVEAVLAGDIRQKQEQPRVRERMRRLLQSLARNESSSASIRTICQDTGGPANKPMDPRTAQSYLDALDRMFLLENQPPFSENLRSSIRVKSAPKRRLADPSIACALLGADAGMLEDDPRTFGFLFESLCVHDLRVYAESFDGKLYHYQDYEGNEIDAVIQLPGGKWCAFEIKLGKKAIDDAAKNLKRISEMIRRRTNGRGPSVLCVVSGLAPGAYRRDDGVFVVPIGVLGP